MCRGKPIARNLTHAGIVSLLLIVSCWAQKPEGAQSAVPPLPAGIPDDAERYSVLIMGNLAFGTTQFEELRGNLLVCLWLPLVHC
jgi:hypothetical protein